MAKNLDDFVVDRLDSIRTAMAKITVNRHRAVVVLDGRQVIGIVSDGDIRRALLKDVMPIAPVEKIMNINCRKTTETDPKKVTEIIHTEMVTVLPIVNEENELVDIALAYEPFFDIDADDEHRPTTG